MTGPNIENDPADLGQPTGDGTGTAMQPQNELADIDEGIEPSGDGIGPRPGGIGPRPGGIGTHRRL